jgi:hypothetical protein
MNSSNSGSKQGHQFSLSLCYIQPRKSTTFSEAELFDIYN